MRRCSIRIHRVRSHVRTLSRSGYVDKKGDNDDEVLVEGAAKLLSAGPLGLGAIIVLVTGTILLSGKEIEQGRLKLSLSLLLAGCVLVLAGFGVLVLQTNAANAEAAARIKQNQALTRHQLYFYVEPLDLDQTLPPPEISINKQPLKEPSYTVEADTTVVISVAKALQQVAGTRINSSSSSDQVKLADGLRGQLSSDVDTSIAQLQRIVLLMSQSCPGGAHGENPAHFGDVVNLTNSIISSLQNTKGAVLNRF